MPIKPTNSCHVNSQPQKHHQQKANDVLSDKLLCNGRRTKT